MKKLITILLFSLVANGQSALPELPPTPLTHPSAYKSPLEFFRKLLVMNREERTTALAARSERSRSVIERKLAEYDSMDPGLRELRLQATELRFYLRPLLSLPSNQRAISVAHMPEKFSKLVQVRLAKWDAMASETRQGILENEWMMHAVLRYGPKFTAVHVARNLPVAEAEKATRQLQAWESLTAEKRRQMINRFNSFFSLNSGEQEKVLARLPEYQRAKVFATLEEIQQLPASDRQDCMASLQRFVSMTPDERIAFFSNAKQWRQLSSLEKKSWRTVVRQFSSAAAPSDAPPLPPGFGKPPPAPIQILTASDIRRP